MGSFASLRMTEGTVSLCMQSTRGLFALALAALCISLAHAQSRIDCSVLQSHALKQRVHYCVLLPSGYDEAVAKRPAKQYPVLYSLHGLGDNEQSLFRSGGWNLIENLRKQHKLGDFLIVTPEGRATFYINSADGRVRYSDFFLGEFIPYIEGKYSIRRGRASRGITGVSMGGYGALRFAFAHPELFGSVSTQSAALMDEQSLGAGRLESQLGGLLGGVFGNPIDHGHWKRNDPLALAKLNAGAIRGMAIYFNCGRNDEYGFAAGAEALHRQLRAQGIKHEYHSYPGNHSASYFLAHIAETMEFHSRAFESGRR